MEPNTQAPELFQQICKDGIPILKSDLYYTLSQEQLPAFFSAYFDTVILKGQVPQGMAPDAIDRARKAFVDTAIARNADEAYRIEPHQTVKGLATLATAALPETGRPVREAIVESAKRGLDEFNLENEITNLAQDPNSILTRLGQASKFMIPKTLYDIASGKTERPIEYLKNVAIKDPAQLALDFPTVSELFLGWITLFARSPIGKLGRTVGGITKDARFGLQKGMTRAAEGVSPKLAKFLAPKPPKRFDPLLEYVRTSGPIAEANLQEISSLLLNSLDPQLMKDGLVDLSRISPREYERLLDHVARNPQVTGLAKRPDTVALVNEIARNMNERGGTVKYLKSLDPGAPIDELYRQVHGQLGIQTMTPPTVQDIIEQNPVRAFLKSAFRDRHWLISEFQNELQRAGIPVAAEILDVPLRLDQAMGRRVEAYFREYHRTVKGVIDSATNYAQAHNLSAKQAMEDIKNYLIYRHVEARNKAIQGMGYSPNNPRGAGISTNDAKAWMAQFTKTHDVTELEKIGKLLTEMNDRTARTLELSGIKPKGWADGVKRRFGDTYVPMTDMLDSQTLEELERAEQIGTGAKTVIRTAYGRSTLPTEHPIVQAYKNYVAAVRAAEYNSVAKTVERLARATSGTGIRRLNHIEVKKLIRQRVQDAAAAHGGKLPVGFTTLAPNEIRYFIGGREHRLVFDKGMEKLAEVLKFGKPKEMEPILNAWNFMQRAALYAAGEFRKSQNPLLQKAAKVLDKWPQAGVLNQFSAQNVTSRSLTFWMNNTLQDVQMALFVAYGEAGKKAAVDVAKNILSGKPYLALSKTDPYWASIAERYFRVGGRTFHSEYLGSQADDIARNLASSIEKSLAGGNVYQMVRGLEDVLEQVNNMTEIGTRLAVFEALLKRGLSDAQAGAYAKSITINFQQKGALAPIINSIWMFGSVNLQGAARMIEALKHPAVKEAAWTLVGMGMWLDAMGRMICGTDPKTGVSKWDAAFNERALSIPLPGKEPIHIPAQRGGLLFLLLGKLLGHEMFSGDPGQKGFGSFLGKGFKLVVDAFSPVSQGVLPSQVAYGLGYFTDEDVFGRPIVPPNDSFTAGKPKYMTYFDSTPKIYQDATRLLAAVFGIDSSEYDSLKRAFFDISPGKLQYFLNGPWVPGYIKDFLNLASWATHEEDRVGPPKVGLFGIQLSDEQLTDRMYWQILTQARGIKAQGDAVRKQAPMKYKEWMEKNGPAYQAAMAVIARHQRISDLIVQNRRPDQPPGAWKERRNAITNMKKQTVYIWMKNKKDQQVREEEAKHQVANPPR